VYMHPKKTDGVAKGSPACHRAVLETVEALRKAGHECVQIDPPDSAWRDRSLLSGKPKLWFQLPSCSDFSLQSLLQTGTRS